MGKCPINPGSLNNKLFLPLILSIAQIILIIVNKYYDILKKHNFEFSNEFKETYFKDKF